MPPQPLEPLTPPAGATDFVPRPGVLRRTAAALAYRDFRVIWFGAFTSSTGTWLQSAAQSWLVLTLTGSAFFLGLDAFLGQFPVMLLTVLGGVLADRWDRRRVLLGSQLVQMATALSLAALVYWQVIAIWQILLLSFVTGCAQAFGGPAYQSLLPSLVPKQDLPNAIALNSIQFNLARVIGPLIAGLALATLGMVFCFTLNGLSFLAVIVAILFLRVPHTAPATARPFWVELRGGLSYVRHERTLLGLTVLAFLTTFLGAPLMTLLPVFTQDVFGRGVGTYTQLMASSGVGSVAGALVMAWLGRFRRMGTVTLALQIVLGFLVVAFAASRTMWFSHALLFVGGAVLMGVFASINSLVQLTAPNEMRGRVMGIYMVAFRGGMPLGSLASGYVANVTSAPVAMGLNGLLLSASAAAFLAWHTRRAAAL